MRVQKWDVFAVKQYPFTLNKTSSFFTLPTILLSMLIVVLAIYLNMSTVCHLWLSRQELPITLAQTLTYPSELTSTRLCYRPRLANASLPSWRVMDASLGLIQLPSVSSTQMLNENPSLQAILGVNFGCFDVAGLQFGQQNRVFYVQVGGDATLFIETASSDQLIWQQSSNFIELNPGFSRVVRILHALVKDSLYLNAGPQEITTFNYDAQPFLSRAYHFPFQSNHSQFALQLYVPSASTFIDTFQYNLMELGITRNDIGTIVGSVISTVSTLVLICGLIVLPIMSRYQVLVEVKSLFHIQRRFANPSLPRFMIASVKKGICLKEDHYVMLSEQLQRIKDVSYSIKVCKTLRKIRPKLPPRIQTENLANEESFGINSQYKDVGLQFYSEQGCEVGSFDPSDDKSEEKQRVMNTKQTLLKWCDIGSDTITLKYYGDGHGTVKSICLSLIFLAGFIAFLYFFNFLSFETTVTSQQLTEPNGYSYTFAQNQLILATGQTFPLIISLLDGNLRPISQITPIQGPQCLGNLTSKQIQQVHAQGQYSYFYCFSGGLTLNYSFYSPKTLSLYIDNSNLAGGYTIFHFSDPSPTSYYRPIDPFALIPPILDPFTLIYPSIEVSVTQITNDDVEQGYLAHFNPILQRGNQLNSLTGLLISLKSTKQLITLTQPSLFDLVQNIWSLGSICFTVLLLKLTKYINLRQKQQAVNPIRAEHRQNLGIMLSKVNKLVMGSKRGELRRVGYYLKEELR